MSIEEDENMPVDVLGRRADVILDPAATINRMNIGRLYEHYVNDVLEQCEMKLRQITCFQPSMSLEDVQCMDQVVIKQAMDYMLGLINMFNPKQAAFISSLTEKEQAEVLFTSMTEHITLHYAPNTETDLPTVCLAIEQSIYKPTLGPVTYVGASGNRCTTENNIRLADLYMMLLDKIADDWSSVSVSKLQHFGIISPQNKNEKFSYPYRCSPVRTQGEAENRVYVGYTEPVNTAELMDRSNNPLTMRNMVWNILHADKPTDIQQLIDRDKIQYGSSKPLQMINHVFNTAGFKLSYKKNRN